MSLQLQRNIIKHSPLKNAAYAVHLMLAFHANDGGWAWPSQKLLAQEARCGLRQVERAIHTLVELGLIVVLQSPTSGRNSYQVLMLPEVEEEESIRHPRREHPSPTSDDHPTPTSGASDAHVGPIEPSVEPKEEPKEEPSSPAPAARDETKHRSGAGEEDASMPAWKSDQPPGELDEQIRTGWREKQQPQQGKAKIVAPANTQRRCIWKFDQRAKAVGQPNYGIGVLRQTIKELRLGEGKAERPYTYTEIEEIIDAFFIRHDQRLRSDVRDVALLFKSMLGQVQRESRDTLRYDSGSHQNEELAEAARRRASLFA